MKISRKGFIKAAAATAAAMSLPAHAAEIGSMSTRGLSASLFARHVGDSFAITGEDRNEELILEAVRKVKSCARTDQFSLVFRSSAGIPVKTGTYRVTHRTVDAPLFLTPGAEPSLVRADFSLLRS